MQGVASQRRQQLPPAIRGVGVDLHPRKARSRGGCDGRRKAWLAALFVFSNCAAGPAVPSPDNSISRDVAYWANERRQASGDVTADLLTLRRQPSAMLQLCCQLLYEFSSLTSKPPSSISICLLEAIFRRSPFSNSLK